MGTNRIGKVVTMLCWCGRDGYREGKGGYRCARKVAAVVCLHPKRGLSSFLPTIVHESRREAQARSAAEELLGALRAYGRRPPQSHYA